MDISFGGIKNLSIKKINHSEYGSYHNNNKIFNYGNKEYEDVFIRCDLTNDEQGNHLSEFRETLAKCRPCYQVNCQDYKNPNSFDIYMSKFKVKGDSVHIRHSNFYINDYDIMLDEPEILPLYTFMAKITREIAQSKDISAANKERAKTVNTTIQDRVMDYIENIM